MDKYDLIGLEVANDGSGLRKALEAHYQITFLDHLGDFWFGAELASGDMLLITTTPVDEEMQTLRIRAIQEFALRGGNEHVQHFERTADIRSSEPDEPDGAPGGCDSEV